MGPFLVGCPSGSHDGADCTAESAPGSGGLFRAAIVLLPSNHVLLDGAWQDGKCAIRVVTDNFKCLPFVQEFLRSRFEAA